MNSKTFILGILFPSVLSAGVAAEKTDKDTLWAHSSEGRELINITTSYGDVIQAVDVDGIAYLGDMILGRTSELKDYGLHIASGQDDPYADDSIPRAAIRFPSSGYKWPNGVVPYEFTSSLGYYGRDAMEKAIEHWNKKTNVKFIRRTNQRNYLAIQGGGGCSSWIGRQGGKQAVTLAEGCGLGAAIHELGHAVGFFHEQSRTDRDDYITIIWDNIERGLEYNFAKMTSRDGQNHGRYDYSSIMHYGITAFGINNAVTIKTPSNIDGRYLGRGTELSRGDIAAAAAIYGDSEIIDGETKVYNGRLSKTNDSAYPLGDSFKYAGGTFKADLKGPSDADFELYLYKWNGSKWNEVDKSESPTSTESISYTASSGYYSLNVHSYKGKGNYELTVTK